MKGEENWKRLLEGNARFVEERMKHPHATQEHRAAIADTQDPLAIILTCADSRVPPEVIFDQGIGDLFAIRIAGNVASDEALGSIEYGAKFLNTPLIVVLGHTKCAAVTNACKAYHEPDHITTLMKSLQPAVERAKGKEGDLVNNAIIENVKYMVDKLKATEPILKTQHDEGKLMIIGAEYDLDTGLVTEICEEIYTDNDTKKSAL